MLWDGVSCCNVLFMTIHRSGARDRPRRNRKQREALVSLWQRSSESVEVFCASHDISLDSFARWLAELEVTGAPSAETPDSHTDAEVHPRQPAFVELPSPQAASFASKASSDGAAEVVLRVELRGDAGKRAIDQVIAMLGGCS